MIIPKRTIMNRMFLPIVVAGALSSYCQAQQLDYAHWTGGETAADHRRPLAWQPFSDSSVQIARGELIIDYEFEIANPGTVPEIVLEFVLWTDPQPWIWGGNDGFHGACWGADGPGREPVSFPLASPLVIPPGQSIVVSGQLDLDGVGAPGGYPGGGTSQCLVSDGIHGDVPGFIMQHPSPGEFYGVYVRAFSGNPLPVTGLLGALWQGAEVTSHTYDLGVTYTLPSVGAPICASVNPNSANMLGNLEIFGFVDAVVEDSLVVLRATDLPVNVFGYFLLSESGSSGTPLGSGLGTLCIGQPLFRWHASVGATDAAGERTVFLPMSDLPIPNGSIAPGETWFFQYWHRDGSQLSGMSNTTGSVAVNF